MHSCSTICAYLAMGLIPTFQCSFRFTQLLIHVPVSDHTKYFQLHKTSATEKRIQHVTADCITFANSEDEASKPPEDPPTKQDELLAARARLLGADAAPVSSSEDAQGKRDFKCVQCLSGLRPPCFVCGGSEDGPGARRKCSLHHCGKFYHPECLRLWPQTKSSVHDSFICPLHVCHTCVSDNPKAACCRSTDNLVRCVRWVWLLLGEGRYW